MLRRVVVASLAVAFGAVAVTERADAVPSFTRQTGMTCAQCHVMFGAPVPNFTFTGKKFRMNGYRLPFVTQKIQAGEQGALSGRRLTMSLFPYLSLRYQSVFAQQAKLPGAAEAGPISSNPTSRLAIFTGGPVADNFGLWTELYLTPDGSTGGEWSLGLFSFDEYDLRFVKSSGNNIFGLAFNNQGIAEVSGFGPWSPGGSQLNRGGIGGWSHPNRGNLLAYGWLNDKVLVAGGASPGQSNLDWERLNYIAQVAIAPWNSDARELWINVMAKFGNDDIPILSNTAVPDTARTWTYRDAVGSLSPVRGTTTPYDPTMMKSFSKVTAEVRHGFVDRGPHSVEVGAAFNTNQEEYRDGAKLAQNSMFGRLRYVNNRTYGLDLTIGKNLTYEYTDPAAVVHDIKDKVSYNSYFTFQPAMNMILALRYGNTQSLDITRDALTGWSWGLNIDFLF